MPNTRRITHSPAGSPRPRPARSDVVTGLQSGRVMARAWSQTVPDRQRQQAAWTFIKAALDEYVAVLSADSTKTICVTPPDIALRYPLEHVAFVTAYLDRSGSPFKKSVDALAWGSYAWFVSEPDGLIELSTTRRSLR